MLVVFVGHHRFKVTDRAVGEGTGIPGGINGRGGISRGIGTVTVIGAAGTEGCAADQNIAGGIGKGGGSRHRNSAVEVGRRCRGSMTVAAGDGYAEGGAGIQVCYMGLGGEIGRCIAVTLGTTSKRCCPGISRRCSIFTVVVALVDTAGTLGRVDASISECGGAGNREGPVDMAGRRLCCRRSASPMTVGAGNDSTTVNALSTGMSNMRGIGSEVTVAHDTGRARAVVPVVSGRCRLVIVTIDAGTSAVDTISSSVGGSRAPVGSGRIVSGES